MITDAAVVVTGLQTCVALTMGQVFRPEDKWGPLSGMMKITHKVREHTQHLYKCEQHFSLHSLQHDCAENFQAQRLSHIEDDITRWPGMVVRIAHFCLHHVGAAGSTHVASGQELETENELQLSSCSTHMAASKGSSLHTSVQRKYEQGVTVNWRRSGNRFT